ncbi:unnamed protein product [Cochlearia groenlandica]
MFNLISAKSHHFQSLPIAVSVSFENLRRRIAESSSSNLRRASPSIAESSSSNLRRASPSIAVSSFISIQISSNDANSKERSKEEDGAEHCSDSGGVEATHSSHAVRVHTGAYSKSTDPIA